MKKIVVITMLLMVVATVSVAQTVGTAVVKKIVKYDTSRVTMARSGWLPINVELTFEQIDSYRTNVHWEFARVRYETYLTFIGVDANKQYWYEGALWVKQGGIIMEHQQCRLKSSTPLSLYDGIIGYDPNGNNKHLYTFTVNSFTSFTFTVRK